jgi:sugar phosphate isomerase/epimerase
MDKPRIGLQLYSLRELTEKDLPGALDTVASLGYEGVEFAGLAGHRPSRLRKTLERTGLHALGAHALLAELELPSTIEDLLELGCETAIVAWLEPELHADEATAKRTVDRLVAVGERARAAGLKYAYHNHDFEFLAQGETTLWSMFEALDPSALPFEIDVYWVRHVGFEPAAFISELGSRVALVHVKDTAADGSGDCAVGTGIEAWSDLLTACRGSGVPWLVVEQERSEDIVADVRTSLLNLRRMLA